MLSRAFCSERHIAVAHRPLERADFDYDYSVEGDGLSLLYSIPVLVQLSKRLVEVILLKPTTHTFGRDRVFLVILV